MTFIIHQFHHTSQPKVGTLNLDIKFWRLTLRCRSPDGAIDPPILYLITQDQHRYLWEQLHHWSGSGGGGRVSEGGAV